MQNKSNEYLEEFKKYLNKEISYLPGNYWWVDSEIKMLVIFNYLYNDLNVFSREQIINMNHKEFLTSNRLSNLILMTNSKDIPHYINMICRVTNVYPWELKYAKASYWSSPVNIRECLLFYLESKGLSREDIFNYTKKFEVFKYLYSIAIYSKHFNKALKHYSFIDRIKLIYPSFEIINLLQLPKEFEKDETVLRELFLYNFKEKGLSIEQAKQLWTSKLVDAIYPRARRLYSLDKLYRIIFNS